MTETLAIENLGAATSVDLVPADIVSFVVTDGRAVVRFNGLGQFILRVTNADGTKCDILGGFQVLDSQSEGPNPAVTTMPPMTSVPQLAQSVACPSTASMSEFWYDVKARMCLRRPKMSFRAVSSVAQITVEKHAASQRGMAMLELRLVAGDLPNAAVVSWTASARIIVDDGGVPITWLSFNPSRGTVGTTNPVVAIFIYLSTVGLNDTALSGPLRSVIDIASRHEAAGAPAGNLIADGTDTLSVDVEMKVEASASLRLTDVKITASPQKVELLSGFKNTLYPDDRLVVIVNAFDYEGFAIHRPTQDLRLVLFKVKDGRIAQDVTYETTMVHESTNTFHGEVPTAWILPGDYRLSVQSIAHNITMANISYDFTMSDTNSLDKKIPISVGLVLSVRLRTAVVPGRCSLPIAVPSGECFCLHEPIPTLLLAPADQPRGMCRVCV
jgi:hypothetical protein